MPRARQGSDIAESDQHTGESEDQPGLLVQRVEMTAALVTARSKDVEHKAERRQRLRTVRLGHRWTVPTPADKIGLNAPAVHECRVEAQAL
jgi:hypothetical protein